MIIEIGVGIIALAFVVLVIFLMISLKRLRKVMKRTERLLSEAQNLLHGLSEPSAELIQNSNKLILDVKKKSEGLDLLFRPLYALKKGTEGHPTWKYADIAGFVLEGIRLFNKIKHEIK